MPLQREVVGNCYGYKFFQNTYLEMNLSNLPVHIGLLILVDL